jgi:peptide/nickel transport system substrate-binding protein
MGTGRRLVNILTLAVLIASLAACAPTAPVPKAGSTSVPAASEKPADKAAAAVPPAATAPAVKPAAKTEEAAADRTGSGGTLTIAMSAGNLPYPNTPPNEGGEGSRFVGLQIYDGLTVFDLDQGDRIPAVKPGLAESWKTGDDKLTWTFKLRPNVTFHDGTPFNADAVVFQLDRIIRKDFEFFDNDLFALNRNLTLQFDTYRAVDPMTVEIKTKVPYAYLLYDLATIMFPSPSVVKKYGNQEYVKYANGTGPYRMTKYVDGQVMELEPNAEYWGGKPNLDKLVLRPMPDPATRLAALQSGEVLWAEVPPPDSVPQLRSSGFNVQLKPYPHTILFFLNAYDPPFNNPKVRQALEYAIDRDKMCDGLLNGLCAPAYQFVYPGHPWFDNTVGKRYAYDPAKAKQLLAEAGFGSGLTINMAYPTGGSGNMWPQPMMELLQANFKAVGVDMQISPLEWNNILTIYRAGFATPEYKKYHGMFYSVGYTTPTFADRYTGYRIPPTGCCNPTGYKVDSVDKLFQDAQSEFDPAKQDALLAQGLGKVADDAASIFIVHDLNLRVLSSKVRGFIQPQSWYIDLKNVWVAK